MEKLPLTTSDNLDPSHPGLPEGLIVGVARHDRRNRIRRGFQALFLLISCLAVANLGLQTIRNHFGGPPHFHPHLHHHHDHDRAHGHPQDLRPFHKGPPEPLACYPLAPGETVNVTLHLKPGSGRYGPPGPSGPPGPPHVYLHPSLFSSDVAMIREGDADKARLGKSPGGPEGITVFALFSRKQVADGDAEVEAEAEVKKVDICTHPAPDGAMVGAFFPPPDHNNSTDPSASFMAKEQGGEDKKKKQKKEEAGKRPFPPHPKDQFPDISAQIIVPSGLGIHLDSLPPPPPPHHHKKHKKHAQHQHNHDDDDDEEEKKEMKEK